MLTFAFRFNVAKLMGPGAKKGARGAQPQVIKFTSCLPMVGVSQQKSNHILGRKNKAIIT
jgi:hypothetical protein